MNREQILQVRWCSATYSLCDLFFHIFTQKSLKYKRVSKFLCLKKKIRRPLRFKHHKNHNHKNIQ